MLVILTEHVKEEIIKLLQSDNVCIKNLATIFLEDYFSSTLYKEYKSLTHMKFLHGIMNDYSKRSE